MTKQFEILRKTRQSLLNLVSSLSVQQLNEIPGGFNNNIIWNLAHLVATLQIICYGRGARPMFAKEELFLAGSKPKSFISSEEIDEIKALLLSSIDRVEADYKKQLFSNKAPWTTRSGIELSTIDDSISFIIYHEGLHTGYIMAMKRLLK
jgi:uncharacterized damage-inducible protein DinB